MAPKQRPADEAQKADERHPDQEKKEAEDPEKLAKVTCFNCTHWGHFSVECREPHLCFICQTGDHLCNALIFTRN
jgi:hypothetical protein